MKLRFEDGDAVVLRVVSAAAPDAHADLTGVVTGCKGDFCRVQLYEGADGAGFGCFDRLTGSKLRPLGRWSYAAIRNAKAPAASEANRPEPDSTAPSAAGGAA